MWSVSSATRRKVLLNVFNLLLLNIGTAELERTSALRNTSSTIITEPLQKNYSTRSTAAVEQLLSSQEMQFKSTTKFHEHLSTTEYSEVSKQDKTVMVNSSSQIHATDPIPNDSKEMSIMVYYSLQKQATEPILQISKDVISIRESSSSQGHAKESIPKVLKETMSVTATAFVLKTLHATDAIPQISKEDKEIESKSAVNIVKPSSQMIKNNRSEVSMIPSKAVQSVAMTVTMTAKQNNPSALIPMGKRSKNATTLKVVMKPVSSEVMTSSLKHIQPTIPLISSTELSNSKAKKNLTFVTSAITEQSKVVEPMRSFSTQKKFSYIAHGKSNKSFTLSIPLNESKAIMRTISNKAGQTMAASSTLKIPFSLNTEKKVTANFTTSSAYKNFESFQTSVKVITQQKWNMSSYSVAEKGAVLISSPSGNQSFTKSEKSNIYSTVTSDELSNQTTTRVVPASSTNIEKAVLLKPSPSPRVEYQSMTGLPFTSVRLNMTTTSFRTSTIENNVIITSVGHSKTEDARNTTLIISAAKQGSSEKLFSMNESRSVQMEFNMSKFSNAVSSYTRTLILNITKSRAVPKLNNQTSIPSIPKHSITSKVRVGIMSSSKDVERSTTIPRSTSSVHLRPTTSPAKLKKQQFRVTIKITSEQFKSEYINESSRAFRDKKREIEDEFNEVFKDMPEYLFTEVLGFFKGSLGCNMIVHMESKKSEPVTVEQVRDTVKKARNTEGGFGKFVVGDIDIEEKNPEVRGRDDDHNKETWGKWPVIVISILGGLCLGLLVIVIGQCLQKRRYSHSLVESNDIQEYSPAIELKNNDDYKDEERIPMKTFNQTDI